MKTGIVIAAALLAGFMAGRQFPSHHYQLLAKENPQLLLDSSTGRVCDVFKSKFLWDKAVAYSNAQLKDQASKRIEPYPVDLSDTPDLAILHGHEPCSTNR